LVAIIVAALFVSTTPSALPAQRQAPITASSTGAEFIDYLVADRIVLPFDQQPHYAERIVQLPHSYLVNDRTKAISAKTPTRAEAGLPDGAFVFCCFNNSFKISATMFDAWMRLLGTVGGSVLWLSEMNPRATQTCHLQLGMRRNLTAALCASVSRSPMAKSPSVTARNTIVLWPHVSENLLPADLVEKAYFDTPRHDPEVVRLYGLSKRFTLSNAMKSLRGIVWKKGQVKITE